MKKNFLDYNYGNCKYLSLLKKFNTSKHDKVDSKKQQKQNMKIKKR